MPDLSIDHRASELLDRLEGLGQAASVRLIVDSGTLLGLTRGGRLLANDTDVDVAATDLSGFERLISLATDARSWRFSDRVYKAEIPLAGTDLTLDVKLFRPDGLDWVSPAIGARASSDQPSALYRRALRPLWRWALNHGDVAHFPLRLLARVDGWVVPRGFFDTTSPLGGRPHCQVPTMNDDYLAFRYGSDWRTPRMEWVSRRDDGAYQSDVAGRLRRSLYQ